MRHGLRFSVISLMVLKRKRRSRSLNTDIAVLLLLHLSLVAVFAGWLYWSTQQVAVRAAQQQLLLEQSVQLARHALYADGAMAPPSPPAPDNAKPLSERMATLLARWESLPDPADIPPEIMSATRQLLREAGSAMQGLDKVVADWQRTTGFSVLLFVIIVLAIDGYALWLYRVRMARPLTLLARQASQLAQGTPAPLQLSRHARSQMQRIGEALSGIGARDAHLWTLLYQDEVSELPNRRAARQRLTDLIDAGTPLEVMLLRSINLSGVRAVYGEQLANQLMQGLARAVQATLNDEAAFMAAYAEDVILLVFLQDDPRPAVDAAMLRRLTQASSESAELPVRPELVAASASQPQHGPAIDDLLGAAMAALDLATARGSGSFEYASDAGSSALRHHLFDQEALRQSFESGDIELWYMPVVDVTARPMRVSHVESLMRLRGADGRRYPLPHDRMDRLMQSPDLLLAVSEQCFRHACATLSSLCKAGYRVGMAFNLSAPELRASHLARLSRYFAESGLPPELLQLEITERVALRGLEQLAPPLQVARDSGVRVVLDDFGTGFSSLSHLVELPIDGIKIDRTFVIGLPDNARAREIVSATAALARALSLDVVVEGVETVAQSDILVELGCQLQQGFLMAHAMPASELLPWLSRGVYRGDTLKAPDA